MRARIHIQKNIFFYFLMLIIGFGGFVFPLFWPQSEGFYAFIASAAFAGFGVAWYIFYTKKEGKQIVCPAGSDCNAVVSSKYSEFMGVPLEYLGMAYYATIFVFYLAFVFVPFFTVPLPIIFSIVMLSFGAFLFSLYLLFVQAVLLKQWCIWCLLSAFLSIAIFIATLVSIPVAVSFLAGIYPVLVAVNLGGFLLGIGAVSAATLLFFRFLRDFDISDREASTLKGVSELAWLGLALVVMSEFAIYLPFAPDIAISGPIAIKFLALFIIIVSSAVLMIILFPLLAVVPFKDKDEIPKPSVLLRARKLIFLIGGISLASWYFAFAMMFAIGRFSFLLVVYLLYLAIASLVSLFTENTLTRPDDSAPLYNE